ncbi:hypothetical protein [Mucilaginibacter ginsenosidivorans]|uniref:Uncharacterized protein n=1 Tax=Mucilaginibacter ginsenosidivorans TaxID=398053 RepID=A0A5B8V1L9_9SPHI|nr:hypothetical protein [Mucilaginibacter ginsenosidivorans]QEC65330.1 hypothetical protein FRZ54_23075 [Mucilaginibacter ginsenosidivorans]
MIFPLLLRVSVITPGIYKNAGREISNHCKHQIISIITHTPTLALVYFHLLLRKAKHQFTDIQQLTKSL